MIMSAPLLYSNLQDTIFSSLSQYSSHFIITASHIISNSLFQAGVNIMGADTNLDLISSNADLHDSSKSNFAFFF